MSVFGIFGRLPILQVETPVFQHVIDVKIMGTFFCSKAVTRHFLQQKSGVILNLSSIMGKSGSPNTLAYNAANFAVVGMTQSMARELGPNG